MYIEGYACWLNNLGNGLEKYNIRVHGTTKMTPFEMSTNQKLIPTLKPSSNNNKQPNIQVGDVVKVFDKRTLYSRGYTFNWNGELFKKHSIIITSPVTVALEDENEEIIQGKYYGQELLEVYLILNLILKH